MLLAEIKQSWNKQIFVLFNELYVQLSDYSTLLIARLDEIINEWITLHNHELILGVMAIMWAQLKIKKMIFPHQHLNHGPQEPQASVVPMSYANPLLPLI